jgi:lysine 6-dehydrogenase
MTTILLIGYGRVGSRTMKYLRELEPSSDFIVVDVDREKLEEARKMEGVEVYLYGPGVLGRLSERADLAVTALPSTRAWRIILELTSRCISIVDVSYLPEDPYILGKVLEDCNSILVVDAGFAPGYSNIVVGYVYYRIGLRDSIEIDVGGIPENPAPPLNHAISWSARDLLEEYIRPARVIEDYTVKSLDPLSVIKRIEVPGVGFFEGFPSDGLRTMPRNIHARVLREYTLRWPGHVYAMKILRDLGFLDSEEIVIGDVGVKPIDFTALIFEKKLPIKTAELAILQVLAEDGDKYYREIAILKGSPQNPATPVFTALVHAYTSKLALKGGLKPGVVSPEELYEYKEDYEEYLKRSGVLISKETSLTQQ